METRIDTDEPSFSIIHEYEVGAGTIDLGRNYEINTVALIALRCLLQDFDDLKIAFNAAGLGALDDIIILARRQNHGDDIKILLQLKHEDKGRHIVKEQFLASTGNYSLLKYSNHIIELKQRIDCKSEQSRIIRDLDTFNNIYFILFTNKGTNECEFLDDRDCDVISFLNTSVDNDNLYKFNLKNVLEVYLI